MVNVYKGKGDALIRVAHTGAYNAVGACNEGFGKSD